MGIISSCSTDSTQAKTPSYKDSENIRKVVEDIFSGADGKEYGSDCVVE
jgi:hypothetical protein